MKIISTILIAIFLLAGLVGCSTIFFPEVEQQSPVEELSVNPEMEKNMLINKYKGEVAINDWEPQDKARMLELIGK